MMKARFPKSIRHWVEQAGFRVVTGRWWRRHGCLMARSTRPDHIRGCRDRKRYIRITPHVNRIDICDGFFDRWANSTGAFAEMPTTKAQFDATLEMLLKKSRGRVRDTHGGPK
jgi:hypothetical protein